MPSDGRRLLSEDPPKTLADFESWLQAALERLQEVLDFDHNMPGRLDEQAHYDAADLVTQAGIFAIPFGTTDIYEQLCRPRKAMTPRAAAICIGKCIEWCQARKASPSGKTQTAPSEYLSIKDAAAVAGLSPTKIRREIKAGRLSASDTGTDRHPHYRIARSDLQAWMEKNKGGKTVPPQNPVFKRKIKSRFFGEI